MLAMRALYTAFLGGMMTLPSMCNAYKSDVGKMCDAEQLSKSSIKADRLGVFNWMERNVASTDGVIFVRGLEGKDARGMSIALREEARKVGLTACALADQADMQAKDDDFHTDMVNLCSGNAPTAGGSVARLDILQAPDDERMREMTAWVATNAKSPDTIALAAKLAAAARNLRGNLLRADATRGGVVSCLMASTLDAQPQVPAVIDPRLPKPNFVVLRVDGSQKLQLSISHQLVQRDTAASINLCYSQALNKVPTTTGKVGFKLLLDPLGKVLKAVDDGSTLKGPIVQCIQPIIQGMALPLPSIDPTKRAPAPPSDASKAAILLQLTPSTSGDGWGATIDPGWFLKVIPKKR